MSKARTPRKETGSSQRSSSRISGKRRSAKSTKPRSRKPATVFIQKEAPARMFEPFSRRQLQYFASQVSDPTLSNLELIDKLRQFHRIIGSTKFWLSLPQNYPPSLSFSRLLD